ncbi:hypothetical protein [Haloarcula nitratireducens]|uniref:Uncharacterized protein n=1 Tax=Haloarcula nitratireducens TaxID=2487749 RepID=A0AAW4PC20_9EURY|nr:hypothetical protein [Halomicroarcula nitratireducens]MBX0294822.1 hypothetical protein [Halomicroarcula nitratireducens]
MSSSSVNELFARFDETVPNIGQSLLAPIRGIAFWTAIALPFLYLPLLASGLHSGSVRTAFAALVVCNAVSLLIGHSHARE